MAVGDIYRVRVLSYWGTGAFHLGYNIMHFRTYIQTGAGATATEIAVALDATWNAFYIAIMSANATYRGTSVQRIWPLPVGVEAYDNQNNSVGGVAGDLMQSESGLIRLRSFQGGKRAHGRIYVNFPSEASSGTTGNPTGTYPTDLQTLANAIGPTQTIVGGGGTVSLEQVIFNRDDPDASLKVITLEAQTLWANQRRRRARGKVVAVLPF